MTSTQVSELFTAAKTRVDFKIAERCARRLQPVDQLDVVDALRSAEERLGIRK